MQKWEPNVEIEPLAKIPFQTLETFFE
jgi:hypothetical protein